MGHCAWGVARGAPVRALWSPRPLSTRRCGSRLHFALLLTPSPPPPFVVRSAQTLEFRCKLYSMREERDIKPATFVQMLSSLLYEKR